MSAVDQNKERKKKQMVLGGTALGLLTVIGLGSIFLLDTENEVELSEESQAVQLEDAGSIDNQDSWRRTVGEEEEARTMALDDLQRANLDQKQVNNDLLQQLSDMNARIADAQNQPPQVIEKVTRVEVPVPSRNSGYTPLNQNPYNTSNNSVLPNPNQAGSIPDTTTSSDALANYANSGGNGNGGFSNQPTQAEPRKVEVISFDTPQKNQNNTDTAVSGSKYKNAGASLIPSTSFVAGTLLNGVDAPTGGQGQSNPLPIVLHVNNLANLPNKNKADIKNCRFLGAAWGDLSSERMMARIESLSCVINGVSYEIPAKGYIVGEDGKAGMRGRLVSKKGKSLGLSFLAGVVSATGSAVQSAATTTTTVGGLTGSSVNSGDIAKAGLGGGVGAGADTLSEYYVKQAEMLFDVIEIDAGRKPEVLVTSAIKFPDGVQLKASGRTRTGLQQRILSDD